MSLLSIMLFRRAVSCLGAFASSKRSSLVFAALVCFGALTASAQLPSVTLTNNSPISVPSQQYGSLSVTITPVGGYSGVVSLTCINMPQYASCKFPNSTSAVNVSGAAVTETFIVNTSQIDDYQSKATPLHNGMSRVALCTLFAPAACLLFFARRRRMKGVMMARLLLCVLVLYPLAGLAGCAAVKPMATPAGTYSFNVTASYGSSSTSTAVTLKVT